MNKKLVAALIALGFAASASAEVNFDQGVDSKSVAKDASSIEMKWNDGPYWGNNPYHGPSPHHVSYSRDCHTFTFGSGSSVMSERVYLDSTEWVEECHYVPDPPPPHNPNHPPKPPMPGHHPKSIDSAMGSVDTKGMQCHQRPGQVFRRTAQISIPARQLFPWETERFEVCLNGPYMDLDIEKQAYNYSVHSIGDYDVRYELTPNNKVAMSPDKDGLSNGGFSVANGRFAFQVNDRWGGEYAGEKVAVRAELYKDGFWFFDSYKGKKEFTFDAARGYSLDFAEGELDNSKSFSADFDPSKSFDVGDITKGSTKYYIKWSFRRIGSISTGEWIEKGKTDKIEAK
ncbi:MAG: hypothetical protein A3J79_10480 [Elusimicrobia bacterium RIFOXYB2_FULL_62_6]|nr:MAG: hypothetical protein A3J79_10480 [Elusimicrobia bacterium RIFOXYB2_FULL_62_6]